MSIVHTNSAKRVTRHLPASWPKSGYACG